MILTDTHTHLYSRDFDADREEAVNKAISKGINRFFIPAIDSSHTTAMYDLEAQFPDNVFLMMGLHPTSVKENFEDELKHIEEQFKERSFYAVGEIGIDLYWDKTLLKEQQIAFKRQIQLAKSKNLPIVIHCRDAFNEVFEVLESEKGDDLYGIFHCFTGNKEQALKALSYNMKLGIGGVVTFKNGGLDKFIAEIPIDHIVLETDAPYLAPAPFRGKRNESAHIQIIAEKIAELYGLHIEEVAAITTKNSKDIFGV
ncbi:TatD DNase family protein [Gillisia mitskevichiae]|uniref:TatD DNase family protein n=1 Tax=Gillisia mitskevichiae TaxID=270921 RepID=A0A495PZ14_9FLAO|nr:TatD family hydrolase [Gillisia mitskevichiae]RKS55809.1 TatD DNase family protein [Gillisia mitskevichiae]